LFEFMLEYTYSASMKTRTRLLALVFFASGLASLAYQVAWQRILTIPLGVGALSTTLIISVYMLGLGIGSLLGSKIADRAGKPFRLYALIQMSLSVTGFASVPVLGLFERLTVHVAPAAAFLLSFAFLCLPTMLMGITLPLLTAIFSRLTGDFTASVSRLYFLNTLGASVGSLTTGYVGVPLLGLDGCIYVAAGLDFALALLIFAASSPDSQSSKVLENISDSARGLDITGTPPYTLAFLAGFLAIGYEILWYRVIGILVKDSPYAFSTILSAYLLGIALGSLGIHRYLARNPEASRRRLFYCIQFLIGLTVLLSFIGYYYLSGSGPLGLLSDWSFSADAHPALDVLANPTIKNLYLLFDVFTWPVFFLLVPAMLMGAGFPLVASVAFSRTGGAGSAVGLTYFYSIIGNMLGGLVTGIVLLPWIGTESTLLAFGMVGLLFGIVPATAGANGTRRPICRAAALALMPVVILFFPGAGKLYGRMHRPPFQPNEIFFKEGLDAVVLTFVNGELVRNFINGQGHGYRPGPIFYAEALEGLSLASSRSRILVVGFGAGSITEASLMADGVQEVTTVELCASVTRNLQDVLPLRGIMKNQRLRLVIDDGRRFLQRSQDRYDVILMDPLRTTTAYSNNLHSKQFFALARQRLRPGGILMVGGTAGHPAIPRTLLEEFAFVRAYPDFSVASDHMLGPNEDRFNELLTAFPPELRAEIKSYRRSALEGDTLRRAVSEWEPNDDWHPSSEYFLGTYLRQGLSWPP
jgi:predicted membrane-bound spermidine synthase